MAASRLMCCGDVMFAEGAEPAYFGVPRDEDPHALYVGQLSVSANRPADVWHPGLSLRDRQNALKKSSVMSASALDSERVPYSRNLPSFEVMEYIEAFNAPSTRHDMVTYKADGLARLVLANAGRERGLLQELRLFVGRTPGDGFIQLSKSRELLWTAIHAMAPARFELVFGFTVERAKTVVCEIDDAFPAPRLSPEEDMWLSELTTSEIENSRGAETDGGDNRPMSDTTPVR